ncbi:MAG TPA: NAD(P)/FAD-dependent oxidoreductase [Eubacteriales bacterium]|nr:NAD(P)/FAD-dependent oxidoreductase [Eubacteriales bacterium]
MKICVVGGGAAGMMAAVTAARNGAETVLIESNEKLGKKIYITGKGRCNMTNFCSPQTFLTNVVTNQKFLYGSINLFPPEKTVEFFNSLGLATKTERGDRVFPLSDKASDVTKTLEKELTRLGCDIKLNTKVKSIDINNGKIVSLTTTSGIVLCDKVILACGGASYAATGSDGNGFSLAKSVGHTVTNLYPSLVDIKTKEDYSLAGLSLTNVNISIIDKSGKTIFSQFGEALFTHDAISGPIILTASAYINKQNINDFTIAVDLKPALTNEILDARILRDFSINSNKTFKNSLNGLLPERLISVIIEVTKINPDKKVNQITAEERAVLVKTLKNFTLTAVKLGDLNTAVVTSGGVSVKEINPKTMQSKLIENLYFSGEMIDVDAVTGGFNLQIAFSTGYAAGLYAATEK